MSVFNHCDVIVQQSNWILWKKKHKIRAIQALKVIQGHRGGINRKPVCDFPLVTDILSRTVSEL